MRNMTDLKTLPLADDHIALNARLGEFAGWRMPLWYRGAVEEHKAVQLTYTFESGQFQPK